MSNLKFFQEIFNKHIVYRPAESGHFLAIKEQNMAEGLPPECRVVNQIAITEDNRFSLFVKSRYSKQYSDLVAWVEWFKKRGINAVLVGSSTGFAVYRDGLLMSSREEIMREIEERCGGSFPDNGISRSRNAVLYCLAQGQLPSEIAEELGMSRSEVTQGMRIASEQLGLNKEVELVAYAKKTFPIADKETV